MGTVMHDDAVLPRLEDGPVVLRAVRPQDRVDRIEAGLDREFLRGLAGDERTACSRLSTAAADSWYEHQRDGLHWVIEREGRCVGNAGFSYLDSVHQRATYAIAIFAAAARGHGIGTAATRLVLRHGFEVLGLHRIDLRVLETNLRAIRCYERCGFVREGIELETAFVDGRWVNDVRMRLLAHEYDALPPEAGADA
ncbi:MAG: GNAT family N-acetyltransferase [Candidatus Dormibacteraeota bacterium]|nr:GNAT family N-acetyltransferase [Candidatus Dormibacteraeota bacterium]